LRLRETAGALTARAGAIDAAAMPRDATELLERCSWPVLGAPYDVALRDAVEFVLGRFDPLGVVAAGSIVRGSPDRSSDLDIFVIHEPLERQRIQRWFQGVPAELFVNPPVAIRRYFVEEAENARPVTAHMLATGHVVLALDPVVTALRDEARTWLGQRGELSESDATRDRYLLATLLEDALDLAERDPALAAALAGKAALGMLEHHCRVKTGVLPRHKDLLEATASIDADLANLARKLFESGAGLERLDYARSIADRTVGARGFFEWESLLEAVEPDDP
jgi:hypothetical protein